MRKVYLDSGTAQRLNSTKNKEYVSLCMFAEGGSRILQRQVNYVARTTYTRIEQKLASVKWWKFAASSLYQYINILKYEGKKT
jgi:hypothetical protein